MAFTNDATFDEVIEHTRSARGIGHKVSHSERHARRPSTSGRRVYIRGKTDYDVCAAFETRSA